MKHLIMLLFIPIFFAESAYAFYESKCNVQYERGDKSFSDKYTLNVQFASGMELNNHTHSLSYSAYKSYALLWFSEKEVAIVELEIFSPIITTFDEFDFNSYINRGYGEVDANQINAPKPRKWKIDCKKSWF